MSAAGLRRLLVPGIAALAAFAILVGLGVWQLQRLQWKEALIAQVASRLDAPPFPAPGPAAWPALDLAALEYRPVFVTGHYRNDREVDVIYTLTDARGPASGIGYMVMTPLETAEGWTVYVNRGFVPRDRKHRDTRRAGLIEGETMVTGLLRRPARRSWFMPGDGATDNEWFSRDPQLFAAAAGLPPATVAPYIIDAAYDPDLPGGLPQGGETLVSFPNSHLGYAITWFGLAGALVAVFIAFAGKRFRGGSG